jgi:predicted ATP-grasp superfamily ATP-dependent carboligase
VRAVESYREIAKVGSNVRDTAKAISGHLRRNGVQTVFVMGGMICATAANGKIASAINDPAPIIGTYGVRSSSADISDDIKEWVREQSVSEIGKVRTCTCCGVAWPEDREFYPTKRGRFLPECKACTYERKARERRAA